MADDDAKLATDDDELIEEARTRLELCITANDSDRALGLEDLLFRNGQQWDPNAVIQRDLDGRPHLTNNNLPAIIHQVTNDVRQNKQAIHVHAVDDKADPDIAEIMEGLCRHIEYDSAADAAYDTALEAAANCGFGFFRLITEYSDPLSFDQDMKIKRIRNAFTVYIDPASSEADASDMRFAFITSRMSKHEFKLAYPKAEATQEAIGKGVGDSANNWIGTDYARVAEYYRVEETPATLVQLSDGTTQLSTDKKPLADGVYPVATRATLTRKICWYKLTSLEVLERGEIPFDWIPIFPVYGDELDLDGDVKRSGIIRHAKDPITMYNYWLTGATEEIALRTKTPFIGAAGQFEGFEEDWTNANNRSFAYLEYNPVTIDGTQAPAPQRQPPVDVPSGYIAMAGIARDNIKAVTGIYDASLGNRSNETSGIGIKARQHQGELANFHLSDNLDRAIRHLGRCIISGIPRVYDSERIIRIMGEDGSADQVKVNQQLAAPQQDPKTGAIKTVLNDLTVGKYDVVVSSGPGFNTAREEATDALLQVGKDWPALYEIAGDKIIGGMPFPGARDIGDRIAKKLGIQEDGDEEQPMVQGPQGPIPINQAGEMIGQMDHTLQAMQAELEKFESGMATEQLKSQTAIEVARITAVGRQDQAELAGAVQLMLAQLEPMVAHQMAVAGAADPAHPDAPAPIAQGLQQAPAEAEAAAQSHDQSMEAQTQGHEQNMEAAAVAPPKGDA